MSHLSATLIRRRMAALVVATAMTLAGCAGDGPPDLDPRLEAAKAAFGGQFEYVYIPSNGRLADEAFVAMSRVAGPREVARALASIMAPAETRPVRVLVTGPSNEKTLRVVIDAFSFYEGRRIPHLELLYLGDSMYEARVGRAVSAVGGSLRFAPYSE